MADESFYGVTLSGENSKIEWDVLCSDEDFPRGQKLIIKQILLDHTAKEDEYNVVEVSTVKDSLRIPIAVLKAGETRALHPDLEFYDTAVTFKLIKGSGPVHIHGQNIKDDIEVVDMEDDTESEEEEGDELPPPKKKFRPENNSDGKAVKNKKK